MKWQNCTTKPKKNARQKGSKHPKHESTSFDNSLACVFPMATMALLQQLYLTASLMENESHFLSNQNHTAHPNRFAMAPDTTTLVKPNRCTFATNASSTVRGCCILWYILTITQHQDHKHQQSRSVLLVLCSHLPL